MYLLAINWASVGVKIAQFILSFSILVVLHELGHYLPAKWFKCRVEKFYLFFNPWFSLYKKKIKDTEWGIGWIPFGGYVKIAGMIDESMDKNAMQQPAKPDEFRAKKAWQRLIIMVGGVIVNVILAVVIFIGMTAYWGDEQLPPQHLKYGLYADSLAQNMGVKTGDIIVKVDTTTVADIAQIEPLIVLNEAKTITVQRNGNLIQLPVPESLHAALNSSKLKGFVYPQYPTIVDSVSASAQIKSGKLIKGDQIIALNNKPVTYYHEFILLRDKYADSTVDLTLLRGTDTVHIACLLKDGKVGFNPVTPDVMFGTVKKHYSLLEAIPAGTKKCFEKLDGYIAGLKQLFNGKAKASENLGSVISIGNTFPGVWDWQRFWALTGIFSIILAFMNILPIPALDGGHALFTIIEIISGKKPSDKFMERAQMVGMVLLLGIMAYALGLDFWRLFK